MAEATEVKDEIKGPGRIAGLKNFAGEVKVEMKKCTWPTWTELREQTGVVIVSVLLLTVVVALSDTVLMTSIKLLFR